MPPTRQQQPPFSKDEKVLCFHMDMLYEAKIMDVQPAGDKSSDGFRYKVHYKGWKNTWDDWVLVDRIRPLDDEHKELAAQLHAQLKNNMQKTSKQPKKNLRPGATESARGSEERGSSAVQGGRGGRRGKDWELEQEDSFHNKPMINLPVPDHIQAMLVDDWENITKNNQLVPLPHEKPVTRVLDDYLNYERPSRPEGSSSLDILEEVIAGLREYFEKALSKILLYRFERHQYMDMRKLWDNNDDQSQYKNVCDVYGAEHLARLIVSLPELLAQTNMDQQSVSRLREEMGKFTMWLGKNCETYFVSEYETPSQEYVDKARSF
ncbi:Chromatin modification-related protein-like protein [Hapsidospora chrysogenum ATCC 11550]|uniref:Chromatin modification-related protein EAF3 n=1 Tax=Hapsidospora chrysogenum (strain ATCC 11550 / CBS 779.69 / DSM 880 / IAM 14645 / JCM 23072 / IMI 49137) TaxID=857340 RepID=A0A086THA8_HAPC1|nr:Chromatin modification-related protein-like protein [Hapsidospora chrysogenum ATCC 11550]